MTTTSAPTTTTNQRLLDWVQEVADLCQPDRVEWCDGSEEEYDRLCQLLVEGGTLTRLDDAKRPNSYWARSDPGDVALSIGFNGTFVLEALASINADQATMTFKDANSQVMIIPTIPSTIEIANVVMPMRI